jgi:hypothetical protein
MEEGCGEGGKQAERVNVGDRDRDRDKMQRQGQVLCPSQSHVDDCVVGIFLTRASESASLIHC